MLWFDIASSLLDERAIIEASAIAVGSSFTALCYFLFRRTESRAKKVENAPALNIDDYLPQALHSSPSSSLPYVAVTGYVGTSDTPLQCSANSSIKGVIWRKTTTEHKDVYYKYSQTWHSTFREVSSISDSIPFHLKSSGSFETVMVVDPLESSWIEGAVEAVHEKFTPTTSSTVENLVGLISGDRLKGYTDSERMLRLGTKLCVIGELAREDNVIQIKPPVRSSSDYIVSTLSQSEIVTKIQRKAKLWKLLAVLVAAASATGLYFLIRRLRKRYKEMRDERTWSEQRNEIRQQRTAVAARGNRDRTVVGDEELCVVCLTNPRECVLLDCGHICVCVDCLEALPSPRECPMCRSPIVRTVPLFHA